MLRRVRSDRNELNRNERPIDFSLIHLIRFLSFRTNPFKLCFVSLVWSLFSPYSFLIKISPETHTYKVAKEITAHCGWLQIVSLRLLSHFTLLIYLLTFLEVTVLLRQLYLIDHVGWYVTEIPLQILTPLADQEVLEKQEATFNCEVSKPNQVMQFDSQNVLRYFNYIFHIYVWSS